MTALGCFATELSLSGGRLVGLLALGGVAGILDSVLGDDAADDGATDGGEALFDEGGDDGFGDLGDDDDFGGLEDDTFDGMEEEGGGGDAELASRVEELENELADISSTMSTVRSENEAMSETVEETEENVRKLLDIYEMVTKGVNPFVDEAGPGAGLDGDGGGDFGLFGDEDGDDEDGETLDDDIADAEAESFFDDDFDEFEEDEDDPFEEGDGDDPFEEDEGDPFEEGEETVEGPDAAAADGAGESDDGDAATTFDQLKEEYESGEADWAEDGVDAAGDDDGEDPLDDIDDDAFGEPAADDAAEDGEMAVADLEADDEFADPAGAFEDGPTGPAGDAAADDHMAGPSADDSVGGAVDGSVETTDQPGDETDTAGEATEGVSETTENSTDTDKTNEKSDSGGAYLNQLPENYAAELVVMEWVDYLVGVGGVRGALGAVRYYEAVGWVAPEVADHLREVVAGMGGEGGGDLTVEHHRKSLQYVRYLGGDR